MGGQVLSLEGLDDAVEPAETIVVVGGGHVGVVTAVTLASDGHPVFVVEPDDARRLLLEAGQSSVHEPGVTPLVSRLLASGRLRVTAELADALPAASVVIIAVGTPEAADGRADLSVLDGVVEEVRLGAHPGTVVILKSTVPPGTAERVEKQLEQRPDPLPVICCPEFLREGSALEDVRTADRLVIGGSDPRAMERVRRLMATPGAEVVTCDATTAELVKYGSNSFLALKISFINEMAALCELMGGDVTRVAYAMGLDTRIGRAYLDAGLGFGGSCFPKDVSALDAAARRSGYTSWLLRTALEVNAQQRIRFVGKIRDAVGNHLDARRIALLGLAFKPGTDDMRQAPSIDIASRLQELGAQVVAHDPVAVPNAMALLPGVEFAPDPVAAVTGADAVAIITQWPEYLSLDWAKLRPLVRNAVVIDGRNCLNGDEVTKAGFSYYSVGRAPRVTEWGRRTSDRRAGAA